MSIKRIGFLAAFLFLSFLSNAQCAMCRASLESDEASNTAEAVNDGIVYLMAFPYLLLILVGYGIYRVMKKKS